MDEEKIDTRVAITKKAEPFENLTCHDCKEKIETGDEYVELDKCKFHKTCWAVRKVMLNKDGEVK